MSAPVNMDFELSRARRGRVPLLLALYGPSGGGKTKSALRIADGIRRVVGGRIAMIDTEARRGLHYADEHDFDHLPLGEPFGSLRYLAAVRYCAERGATIVIIDSASHEHEGLGGYLQFHASEVERLVREWRSTEKKVNFAAYIKPAAQRQQMINGLLQMPIHLIFCFRAKDKLQIIPGKDPVPKGFMPITGEPFIYDMTASALLLPCADGVPTWQSEEMGEKKMVKRPSFFRKVISQFEGKPLCEDLGEAMARWAEGGEATVGDAAEEMRAAFESVTNEEQLAATGARWAPLFPKEQRNRRALFTAAYKAAQERIAASAERQPGEN